MKKRNSVLLLSIIMGLLFSGLYAQESVPGKIRELHLSGNILTFSNFGLQYKSELRNGNFFRIGLNSLNFNINKSNPGSSVAYNSVSTSFSGGFDIGLEKRKQITEKLTAFYGINFTTSVSFDRSKYENPSLPQNLRYLDSFSINPGLGFNSGFILKISDAFLISAEVIPKLILRYSSSQGIDGSDKVKHINTGGSFNFDNQSVLVSLIYRWNKN
jgi:hypothetical protein